MDLPADINSAQPHVVSYGVARTALEEKCVIRAKEAKKIVLAGSRGNGKTQLARKIANTLACSEVPIKEVDCASEEEMLALLDDCTKYQNNCGSQVLIVDAVSQQTLQNYAHLKKVLPRHWILIVTTLDENLDAEHHVQVPGLSLDEFYCLINNLLKEGEVVPVGLVEEFYETLDGNPLDLRYAVEYLKRTKKTAQEYLRDLQKGHAHKLPNERALFQENEYSSSLQTMLASDLKKILTNLKRFPLALEALWALAFFHNKNIPIEAFSTVFDGRNLYDVADIILEQAGTFSLGKVMYKDDCRFLTLNKVFQRALIAEMDDQTKQRSVELACKVLLHLCHKDNLVKADYEAQVNVEPHVKSVLDQALPKKSVGVTILKVWLLSSLGHYYIQTDQISKGESTLEKAMKIIENDILKGKWKLLDLKKSEVSLLFLKPKHTKKVKEFVHSLRISSSDKAKWSSRAPELDKCFDNKATSLTAELYEMLVENNCAYNIDKVVPYFIAEVVATVLYSYGRIFLYNVMDKAKKESALKVCKVICQTIEETFDVKLLHTELVDRNGLLCFKLKTVKNELQSQEMMKNALDAVSGYDEILSKSCNRYEYGLLKCIQHEQYHRMVCLRYRLKAKKILWKVASNNKEKLTYKKQILDCIKDLDNILGDRSTPTGNLQRNTSVQNEIASALFLLEDEEHWHSAKERFLHVCEDEKNCSKINYPWREALEGLIELARNWVHYNPDEAIAIAKQVRKEVRLYQTRSGEISGYDDNEEPANNLLSNIKDVLKELENQREENLYVTNSLKSTQCPPSSFFNCMDE